MMNSKRLLVLFAAVIFAAVGALSARADVADPGEGDDDDEQDCECTSVGGTPDPAPRMISLLADLATP